VLDGIVNMELAIVNLKKWCWSAD